MANRNFDEKWNTIQKRMVSLWAVIGVPSGTTPVLQKYSYGTFGTGGRVYTAAPTTGGGQGFQTRYAQGAEGIFSVVRTGVGLYTLTLQDQYQRLLGVTGNMSFPGGTANVVTVTENPSVTNMVATGGSVVGVSLLSATGALADPTANALTRVYIRLDLQDATEP